MSLQPHLLPLTGIRFFAALHVVLYHLWRYDVWKPPVLVERAIAAGPVAVTLFFVLSGFILTYNYARLESGAARLLTSSKSFWWARFSRIFPVYVVGLLISLPIVLVLLKRSADGSLALEMGKGAAAFLLVQSWWPQWALAWNPPAWSISVEAFFYLLFPLLATRLLRVSLKKALVFAALGWIFSLLLSAAYLYFDPDQLGRAATHRDHAFWWEALKYHPLVRLPEFIVGVVAGRICLQRRASKEALAAGQANLIALAIVAVTFGISVSGIPHGLLHNALFAPLFALVFVLLGDVQPPSLFRVFGAPVFVRLGEASYALYILHVPLLYWIAGIGERRTGRKVLEEPLIAAASVVVVVVASLLAHRFVEVPLRNKLRGTLPQADH